MTWPQGLFLLGNNICLPGLALYSLQTSFALDPLNSLTKNQRAGDVTSILCGRKVKPEQR